MDKRFQLSEIDLDEISLVVSGDDPEAKVVIAKAAPMDHMPKNMPKGKAKAKRPWFLNRSKKDQAKDKEMGVKKSGDFQEDSFTLPLTTNSEDAMGDKNEEITKDDLPQEVVEYIEALESEVDSLTEVVEKAANEVKPTPQEVVKGALADLLKADAGSGSPEWLSKADPEMKAYIEKQASDLAAVTEIAKAEREARLTSEYISKAEGFTALPAETSELATTLRELSETSPELAAKVEKILVASDAQLRKSAVFGEMGGSGSTTIHKSVEGKVEALRKQDPSLTKEAALASVYSENPDLYEQEA